MTPLPGSLQVTGIEFIGNTVFSQEQLGKIAVLSPEIGISSIDNQNLEFSELLQIATKVAEYYHKEGYTTSGAVVVIPKATREKGVGMIQIRVIEGILTEIQVNIQDENVIDTRFHDYVRRRLKVVENQPLNVNTLLEALQLLQLDPLIKQISATLSSGTQPESSRLIVTYQPNNPLSFPVILDNGRSPSVGSFERGFSVKYDNLLGFGDKILLGYINTDGSDRPSFRYEIPFNADNGTIRLDYSYNNSAIIEAPFDDVNQDGISGDIKSRYEAYDFTIRQPLIRSIQNQTLTEFGISLNVSWRNTQSFLFDQPFPFSLSADVLGNTRLFALRLSQDYSRQNATEIYAFNSQISLGLGVFGSTISPQISGIDIPDSQFIAWRGQGQYIRVLAPNTLWLVRSNLQVADRPLLPIEQFSIGGLGSVRGYRQDQLLTDNGFFASTEVRFPILTFPVLEKESILQVIPFIDYGLGWNTSLPSPNPNSLVSVGLGILWQWGNFNARLDWGIPLTDFPRNQNSWNENGLYFTIQYGL
ncbi:hemolysin activation/secretion protein [Aphanothece sacrum FPU3]|nr:hemolysin activation/secretion protein [Aphanothece sacrum FPU3]